MPYWLFSMMKMQGSFQSAAMLSASWKAPVFTTDSPMKQTMTWSPPRYLIAKPTPAATGTCAADDAVPAEEVQVAVEEVHRAALAARAAVHAPEELGHDRARRHAAGECLAVVAVGGDDVVVGAEHREHARGDRLLPDVEVAEAADLPERVRLADLLLEATLEEHRVEEFAAEFGIAGEFGGVGLLLRGHANGR